MQILPFTILSSHLRSYLKNTFNCPTTAPTLQNKVTSKQYKSPLQGPGNNPDFISVFSIPFQSIPSKPSKKQFCRQNHDTYMKIGHMSVVGLWSIQSYPSLLDRFIKMDFHTELYIRTVGYVITGHRKTSGHHINCKALGSNLEMSTFSVPAA